MFKSLLNWFKSENLLAQAKDEVLDMLRRDLAMYRDSVLLLCCGEGVGLDEIRERDRQINRLVRDVRKKVLTHLAFSGSSGLDTSLVLVSIVVDIERIGDYTKDIAYLASDFPGKFIPGEFEPELKNFEQQIESRLQGLIAVFEQDHEDGSLAVELARTHREVDEQYRRMLRRLITKEDLALTPNQSALLALYLRYLRRIEGHIFNIASAEVNPFHRIGFRVKKKT